MSTTDRHVPSTPNSELLAVAFARSPVPTMIVGEDGIVAFVNDAAALELEGLGYARTELLGRAWMAELLSEESSTRFAQLLARSASHGTSTLFRGQLRDAGPRATTLAWVVTPLDTGPADERLGPGYVLTRRSATHTTAVHEHRANDGVVNEPKAESTRYQELVLEVARDGCLRILDVNPAYLELTKSNDLIGLSLEAHLGQLGFTQIDIAHYLEMTYLVAHTGESVSYSFDLGYFGAEGLGIITLSPIQNDAAEHQLVQFTCRPLFAILDDELRTRRVLDGLPSLVGVFDLEGRIIELNRAVAEFADLELDEVRGKPALELWSRRDDPVAAATVVDAMRRAAGGETVRLDVPMGRADGDGVADVTLSPLWDRNRVPEGIIVSFIDVSERRRIEREHREARQFMEMALRGLPVIVTTMDLDGTFTICDGKALRPLAISPKALVGRSLFEFASKMPQLSQAFERAKQGDTVELSQRICGVHFDAIFGPLRDHDGAVIGVVSVGLDATERHRAEREIGRRLEEKATLLRELQHRVKNNLQVVASLMSLQELRANAPEVIVALRQSRLRIAAMAIAHDALHQRSTMTGLIELLDYARKLCASVVTAFSSETRIDVNVRGAEMDIALDDAVLIGVILSELVFNALRRAFTATNHGHVEVSFAATCGHVCMTLLHDGDDEVRRSDSCPLEMQLVEDLCKKLRGSVKHHEGPAGTGYRVELPVADPRI